MSKALEDYADETGVRPYVKKRSRKYDTERALDWVCDTVNSGCITGGSTGIAWRAVEAVGSKLGYSNNYTFFNTKPFDTLGPMFLVLGLLFYDAHRYGLENAGRLLDRITKYFKK
jgi:hypothetical protein